jgi:hypothetical protein
VGLNPPAEGFSFTRFLNRCCDASWLQPLRSLSEVQIRAGNGGSDPSAIIEGRYGVSDNTVYVEDDRVPNPRVHRPTVVLLGSWFNSGHQKVLSHRAPPGTNGARDALGGSRPPISPLLVLGRLPRA